MNQVVVLCNNLCSWSREVQGVGLLCSAEVMEFEDKVLGQELFVSPDDPTDACVDESEFVARSVDRLHAWELEIPFESGFGVGEGRDETP